MKKALLLSVALVFAASGFAQTANGSQKVKKSLPTNLSIRYGMASMNEMKSAPRKSVTSGTYYSRPEGAFWVGFEEDGNGFGMSICDVPAWTDITFTNMSTAKTGAWHFNFYDSTSGNFSGQEDVSSLATGGNLVWNQYPGLWYATPTLVNGTDSFRLGDENLFMLYYNTKKYSARIGTDSVCYHPVADDHEAFVYQSKNYNNTAGWGFLTTDNMFGTGNVEETDATTGKVTATYVSYGIEQYFGKTAAPFYVVNADVRGYSSTGTPIAKGDTLKMFVVKAVAKTNSSNVTEFVTSDEVLDTLYATSTDTVDFKTAKTRNSKTVYSGMVKFFKKTIDPLTGESSSTGFTIPANTPFALVITGFDKSGIDFGPNGFRLGDNNNYGIQSGYVLCANSDKSLKYSYSDRMAAQLYLNGMYDAVYVPESGVFKSEATGIKYNVLRVSADGKTTLTDGQTSTTGLPGALVGTMTAPYDGDGNANYSISNLPDWITGVNFDDSKRTDWDGLNVVTFEVSALPAGTTGRAAVVYANGKGVTGNNPIYILQGDAKITDGISNVKTDKVNASSAVYNLNGQRVSKATKGILIQNGEKFINK